MSFIFAAKKPSEFAEHRTTYDYTQYRYPCYELRANILYDSPPFSANEIWFSVWGSSYANISSQNYYILSAGTDVSVRRLNSTNAAVYVNNTDTGERFNWRANLNPYLFHVKTGVSTGVFEIFYDGQLVYSANNTNILNGEPIEKVRLRDGYEQIGALMVMRDAVVATHEIPCGLLLEEVAADISALNGWTQSGTELSTETAGATFTMKPNAAAIATLSATKSIDGILPAFSGAASTNVSSIDINSDDSIPLSTTSTDYAGKVRTLAQANAGLTVEAVA